MAQENSLNNSEGQAGQDYKDEITQEIEVLEDQTSGMANPDLLQALKTAMEQQITDDAMNNIRAMVTNNYHAHFQNELNNAGREGNVRRFVLLRQALQPESFSRPHFIKLNGLLNGNQEFHDVEGITAFYKFEIDNQIKIAEQAGDTDTTAILYEAMQLPVITQETMMDIKKELGDKNIKLEPVTSPKGVAFTGVNKPPVKGLDPNQGPDVGRTSQMHHVQGTEEDDQFRDNENLTALVTLPGRGINSSCKTVGWIPGTSKNKKAYAFINRYGPKNSAVHRLQTFASVGYKYPESEKVDSLQSNASHLENPGDYLCAIYAVAWFGWKGEPVSEADLELLDPRSGCKNFRKRTLMQVAWRYEDNTIKKSWVVRGVVRKAWGLAYADGQIFEAAKVAEKRHDMWKNNERKGFERSPSAPLFEHGRNQRTGSRPRRLSAKPPRSESIQSYRYPYSSAPDLTDESDASSDSLYRSRHFSQPARQQTRRETPPSMYQPDFFHSLPHSPSPPRYPTRSTRQRPEIRKSTGEMEDYLQAWMEAFSLQDFQNLSNENRAQFIEDWMWRKQQLGYEGKSTYRSH